MKELRVNNMKKTKFKFPKLPDYTSAVCLIVGINVVYFRGIELPVWVSPTVYTIAFSAMVVLVIKRDHEITKLKTSLERATELIKIDFFNSFFDSLFGISNECSTKPTLQDQLKEAIEKQDFEEAARLRDLIKSNEK